MANNAIDCMSMARPRIKDASQASQYSLIEGFPSILLLQNPLQLALLVGIQDPWVIV